MSALVRRFQRKGAESCATWRSPSEYNEGTYSEILNQEDGVNCTRVERCQNSLDQFTQFDLEPAPLSRQLASCRL